MQPGYKSELEFCPILAWTVDNSRCGIMLPTSGTNHRDLSFVTYHFLSIVERTGTTVTWYLQQYRVFVGANVLTNAIFDDSNAFGAKIKVIGFMQAAIVLRAINLESPSNGVFVAREMTRLD